MRDSRRPAGLVADLGRAGDAGAWQVAQACAYSGGAAVAAAGAGRRRGARGDLRVGLLALASGSRRAPALGAAAVDPAVAAAPVPPAPAAAVVVAGAVAAGGAGSGKLAPALLVMKTTARAIS